MSASNDGGNYRDIEARLYIMAIACREDKGPAEDSGRPIHPWVLEALRRAYAIGAQTITARTVNMPHTPPEWDEIAMRLSSQLMTRHYTGGFIQFQNAIHCAIVEGIRTVVQPEAPAAQREPDYGARLGNRLPG